MIILLLLLHLTVWNDAIPIWRNHKSNTVHLQLVIKVNYAK